MSFIKIKPTDNPITIPQYWEAQVISPTQTNVFYNTGNVGIGVPIPKASLHIVNNVGIGSAYATSDVPTDGLIVSGNVGIGTATPLANLHVNGTIKNSNPSFCAMYDVSGVSVGASVKIICNVIFSNTGSYDATTGRFTAPIAGRYFFTFTGMTASPSTFPNYTFIKNGVNTGPQTYGYTGQYSRGNMSAIFDLAAGGYVEIRTGTTTSLHWNFNQFCGYLIG